MSGEGGGLPHVFHVLKPVHFGFFPGAPHMESYAVSYSLLAMGVILLVALVARLSLKLVPGRAQNLTEWLVDTVEDQGRSVFGENAMRYMPFYVTVFLFILTSNLMGLIPGFMSPTASYHTNFAMAISVALLTQWAGIRTLGLRGYLKHFMPPDAPWWLKWPLLSWMWPVIELMSQFIRPISLTMRLFGNIFAKEMLLLMLAFLSVTFWGSPSSIAKVLTVFPLVLRPAIIILGTLISIIQAAVFTILSMVYVAMAVAHHEEPREGAHEAAPGGATHQ